MKINANGTSAVNFQVDATNTGPQIRNSSGELQVRNAGNTDDAALKCGGLHVVDDLQVDGAMIVNGGTQFLGETRSSDNTLTLNHGYIAETAQHAGIMAILDPVATTADTGTVTSPTTITTVGSATFIAGDYVQITSAADAANNAVIRVNSHILTALTIDSGGEGDTDFIMKSLAGAGAVTLTKVGVAFLRFSKTTGELESTGLVSNTGGADTAPTFNEVLTSASAGTGTTSVGGTIAHGVSADYARTDHVHDIGVSAIDAANMFLAGVVDTAALGALAVTSPKAGAGIAQEVKVAIPTGAGGGTADSVITTPASSRMQKLVVDVTTGFDSSGALTLSIGSKVTLATRYLAASSILGAIDTYVYDGLDIACDAAEEVRLTLARADGTVGAGSVTAFFGIPAV